MRAAEVLVFTRRSPGTGAHLQWRVRLFAAGALLAVFGMAINTRWLVWVAMGLLGVGFFLRFLPAPEDAPRDDESPSAPTPDQDPR